MNAAAVATEPTFDPALTRMEHSCRLVRPIFIYLKNEFGDAAFETICERAGLPPSYLMDEHNWMSHRFYKRILEELVEYTGDPRSPYKAGLYAATPEGYGHLYWLLRAFGSPRMIYEQVVRMVPKFTKVARYELVEISNNRVVLELRHNEGYEQSKLACLDAIGELASVASVQGGPPARAVEHSCQADGADACVYELTWINRPNAVLRLAGIALGSALVGADLLLGPVVLTGSNATAETVLACALPVLGYLAGWAMDLARSNVWNERLTRELDKSLIESMEAVEKKFAALREAQDEVADTNTRLERSNLELNQLNTELGDAYEGLKRLDKKKTEFLRIVAHDLKTPLASMRTYAKMLQMYDDIGEDDRRVFLSTIEEESVRLSDIVNRFLDLTQIESRTLHMEIAEVDLGHLVDHLANVYQTSARDAGIELVVEIDEDLPTVMGDAGRLGQAIGNLLANATKFSREGSQVRLVATTILGEDGSQEAWIRVQDNGPGIPPERNFRVYEKFYVADQKQGERGITGQGLGLFIASQIVASHHGKLWHECPPEGGTIFHVRFPTKNTSLEESFVQ